MLGKNKNNNIPDKDIESINSVMGATKAVAVSKKGFNSKPERLGLVDINKPKYAIQSFPGKQLKIDKGYYQNGRTVMVKSGTKWEDIKSEHRLRISFNDSDFE